ncbi:DUF4296 domain-containing protein [Ancylomarina longa]|uniref:DUF4296 domain-containing protein n=1 Tax=Ancylomarina longa TaxID=2487017 RepID=A0A434ATE9_9BACT|nr:DUF4296 domain-containing protein [Ancylomarina longa]RUT77708.1 DUF4296 domain-containing protein [Ancylomarina longa]
MSKILIVGFCLSVFLCISCKKEMVKKPKLSEDEFTKMLIDIHIGDGTMTAENIYRSGQNYRPSYYYNSIYQKYNITAAQFDSCVHYYSLNTVKYTKIYDKIIDSLNRLETKLRIELKKTKLEQDTVNLWKKRQDWKVPAQGRPIFNFSIPIREKGIYTIRAKIKVYKGDQTYDPRMEAYFWKKDTVNGQSVKFDPKKIVKDSEFHEYEIQMEYPDSTYTQLRGNIFANSNDLPQFTQHYEIKDILIFNPQIKPDTVNLESEELRLLDRAPEDVRVP